MLHFKGGQGGAQNHRAVIILGSIFLALHISACQSAADRQAEEREQLYRTHFLDAQQQLDIIYDQESDSTYADRMARRYYEEGGKWVWMGEPGQLELAVVLDSLMHDRVTGIGFDKEKFCLTAIDSGLTVMRQPNSARGLAVTMAQMEHDLTKAYLRYTIGERFGFSTPSKLFGKGCYDVDIEQADSAYVAEAFAQLKSRQKMEDFIRAAEPSDSAYQRLKRKLATDSTEAARNLTLCNMERLRWRDKRQTRQAERHIFVNVAAQQVWAVGPDSVINMRIACGKASTKTPLLSSEIRRIEVNPEWGIPQSIIRGEVSHHAGDSAYFARRNYYITNGSGQRVDPRNLSSAELASGRYAVRQRSGAGNSLGRIIFRFDNKFSVYLHDTSSPSVFKQDSRTVSHGCVRLQRPFDIAEFVLPQADEWTLDKMRLSMDLPPKTEQGKEYKRTHSGAIRLINNTSVEPHVPLIIDYYTLYPNPQTGKLDTWGDPYGYDKIVLKAIKPYLP